MLSKCANPTCSATFRYLHDGTLFHVVIEPAAPERPASYETATIERFWLCGECSRKMTVISGPAGIIVVPLQQPSKPERRAIPGRRWNSA